MRAELHYTLTQIETIPELAGATVLCELGPRYNIAPGQSAPVILMRDGIRVVDSLRWGLLPRWRGHGGTRGPLVHAAPIEAVAGTPLLRQAFRKHRCLVLADGCFAWRELKQPVWFHPFPATPIAFAGVWNVSDDDGEQSFAILLGPSLVTRVRDPMPIVLPVEAFDTWLDPRTKPDEANDLTGGSLLASWRADPVSTRMAQAVNDDPACIAPIGNSNQGELF